MIIPSHHVSKPQGTVVRIGALRPRWGRCRGKHSVLLVARKLINSLEHGTQLGWLGIFRNSSLETRRIGNTSVTRHGGVSNFGGDVVDPHAVIPTRYGG